MGAQGEGGRHNHKQFLPKQLFADALDLAHSPLELFGQAPIAPVVIAELRLTSNTSNCRSARPGVCPVLFQQQHKRYSLVAQFLMERASSPTMNRNCRHVRPESRHTEPLAAE